MGRTDYIVTAGVGFDLDRSSAKNTIGNFEAVAATLNTVATRNAAKGFSENEALYKKSMANITKANKKADDDLLIIDCHAHIYGEDEQKYPTVEKPYRPPAGKGTVAHLKQEMKSNGVRFVTAITVVVVISGDFGRKSLFCNAWASCRN